MLLFPETVLEGSLPLFSCSAVIAPRERRKCLMSGETAVGVQRLVMRDTLRCRFRWLGWLKASVYRNTSVHRESVRRRKIKNYAVCFILPKKGSSVLHLWHLWKIVWSFPRWPSRDFSSSSLPFCSCLTLKRTISGESPIIKRYKTTNDAWQLLKTLPVASFTCSPGKQGHELTERIEIYLFFRSSV